MILALYQLSYQCLHKKKSLFRQHVHAVIAFAIAAATTAALGITFCWKIAGLRPAIFSGTPGNFELKFLKGEAILDHLVEQTPIE